MSSPIVSQTPDPRSTDLLLKVLRAGGRPPLATTAERWSLPTQQPDGSWAPGDWWEVKGRLVPCENGLHVCRVIDLPNWIQNADEIYVVEYDGRLIVHEDGTRESKVVVKKARLARRVSYTDTILRSWAADCAEHVLSIYEARYPDDQRPRRAIEAARAYVRGEIGLEALRQAKEGAWAAQQNAAYAAADAAAAANAANAADAAAYYAAYAAGWAAAGWAADAAAAAAADAAAAARKKEIEWQAVALASRLGLPGYARAADPPFAPASTDGGAP